MSDNNIVTRNDCEKHINNFNTKMDKLKDRIVDVEKNVISAIAHLKEDVFEKADKKYATKKTEKTVDKVMWLVISSVVIAVLSLILK